MGHEVRVTGGAAEALELAAAERFDVVLTDLHVPELDGAGLVRALRALPPPFGEVPVLVLSADVDPAVGQRFDGLEVKAVLTKPVDFAALGRRLDAL